MSTFQFGVLLDSAWHPCPFIGVGTGTTRHLDGKGIEEQGQKKGVVVDTEVARTRNRVSELRLNIVAGVCL